MPLAMPPAWEVGLRGGYLCEVESGAWVAGTTYTVRLRLLADLRVAMGPTGQGAVCAVRNVRWLRFWTPALTPGLWRVEVTPNPAGATIVVGTLRALPDDLPWHTFEARDHFPDSVYRAGPRAMENDA